MTVRISVNLHQLTWGDLYALVDVAIGAGVSPADYVQMELSPQDDETPVALQLDVEDATRRSVTLDEDERLSFAAVLALIVAKDGDARAELQRLDNLRDRLLRADG